MKITPAVYSYKKDYTSSSKNHQNRTPREDVFCRAESNSATPAFKGILKDFFQSKAVSATTLSEKLHDFFYPQEDDKAISANQVNEKLKTAKIRYPKDFYPLLKSKNQYSQNLTDKVVDLQSKVGDQHLTWLLFKNCRSNDKFNPKIYRDINLLLKKGIEPAKIVGIMETVTCYNNSPYNPKIAKFVLNIPDESKTENSDFHIMSSVNKKTNEFSPAHYDMLERISKEFGFNEKQSLPYSLRVYTNQKVTQETENQVRRLFELGFEIKDVLSILNTLDANTEILAALTQDILELKDKTQLKDFLINRMDCAQGERHLLKDHFDYYTQLCKEITNKDETIPFEKVQRNIIECTRDEIKEFTLSAIKHLPLEDINQILQEEYDWRYGKIFEEFKALSDNDKPDFVKIRNQIKRLYPYEHKVEIQNYLINVYPKCKDQTSALHFLNILIAVYRHNGTINSLQEDYILKNLDKTPEQMVLDLKYVRNSEISPHKLKAIEKLLNNGYTVQDLSNVDFTDYTPLEHDNDDVTQEEIDAFVDKLIMLKKNDVSFGYIRRIIRNRLSNENFNKLLEIRNEAINRRDTLQTFGAPLTTSEIDDVFLAEPKKTLNMLKILGQKGLVQAFVDGIDNVESYIAEVFSTDPSENSFYEKAAKSYETLLEMTNPVESTKYKTLDADIKDLKAEFPYVHTEEEKQSLIKQINDKTKEKNELVKNAIKDPQDILSAALIFFTLLNNNIDADDYDTYSEEIEGQKQLNKNLKNIKKILLYLNPKTPEDREKCHTMLNRMISDLYMDKPLSKETMNKLKLKDSRYLTTLFNPDKDFFDTFGKFLEILEKNKSNSTRDIFNNLEQNVKTKEIFDQYGLGYDKWISVNPDTKVELKIKTNTEKTKQNILKNIEADFNDEAMQHIPKEQRNSLFTALQKAGFEVIEKEVVTYDAEGIAENKKQTLKIYKNSKPLEFKDAHKLISAIRMEMNKNDFWNSCTFNSTLENAKDTLKNHFLQLRYNEIKNAESKNAEKEKTIEIQKTDMNNISHSLFLGNDAGCCTAIGTGCNMWSAPNYIMNKFVSAIEVKYGNRYVGNTMVYPILINEKPALLLDNIELKSEFQYNEDIKNGILECAKNITKELGQPDMPIYAGPNRHKVHLDEYEIAKKDFKILGSSGNTDIYLDFMTDTDTVSPKLGYSGFELFKIR